MNVGIPEHYVCCVLKLGKWKNSEEHVLSDWGEGNNKKVINGRYIDYYYYFLHQIDNSDLYWKSMNVCFIHGYGEGQWLGK